MDTAIPAAPQAPAPPQGFAKYWLATRPYSFTAAVVPALLGTATAKFVHPDSSTNWLAFLMVVVGCVAIQTVSNLVNDLFDAKSGLDNPNNFGRMNCIVNGLVTKEEVVNLILFASLISGAIGAYFVAQIGTPMLAVVSLGAFLAFEYTAPPLKLKYRALGDVAVMLGFGLGMVFGAYLVQAHDQPDVFAGSQLVRLLGFSLPSALLVVAILHANNHRDRLNDREFGATTLGNVLSEAGSKKLLIGLLIGAYAISIAAAVTGITSWFNLIVLLSVPPLMAVLKAINVDDYSMSVPNIAKLHGMFGLLTTIGVVLKIVLH